MLKAERLVWLAAMVATGITCWAMGQDRKLVDPSMNILLENDRVRVQEHFVKVGQTIPVHSHPAKVIYALNDWKVRETLTDGNAVAKLGGRAKSWLGPLGMKSVRFWRSKLA